MTNNEPFYYKYAGSSLMDMFEIAHELETRNTKLINEIGYLRNENYEMKKQVIDLKDQIAKQHAEHQSTLKYYDNRIDDYERDEQHSRDMYKDQDLGPCWS